MNAANAVRLMEMLTYYQPNTPKPDNPEVASDVWAYELKDFEFEDARDAIQIYGVHVRQRIRHPAVQPALPRRGFRTPPGFAGGPGRTPASRHPARPPARRVRPAAFHGSQR